MCLGLGELQSVDGYMNIALEKCEEHVNGVKKRSYGDAFVRGNNGIFVLKYWDRLRNLG
jgi:U6 snRNA-associated Sm-like protein LSm6